MNQDLLYHYERELKHLRESAAEFALQHPKIAGRLALPRDGKEICPDPFVERLLEGFAWLAARVHLKLDAEFPRFTQALLETIYPHYLSPVPSMAMVRIAPDLQDGALAAGSLVPRGTSVFSNLARGERTRCQFRTAHDVTLWPLQITEARYYTTRDLGELALPPSLNAKAAIRIRLEATAGASFKDVKLDRLTFFLHAADDLPDRIYGQIFSQKSGVVLQTAVRPVKSLAVLPAANVRQVGFAENESLLPYSPRGFQGYRLLQEYFAFPQRFLFFEVTGLTAGVKLCDAKQLDLVLALKEQDVSLERQLTADTFDLFCTPIINLFSKSCDRISLSDRFSEFHLIPDKTRPLDFEVFEVENVTGYGESAGEEQEFRPFYMARDTAWESGAFYTVNRIPRVLTERERRFGKVSDYGGSELFLSLVDARAAPYRSDLRQLGVRALCTNRHLPRQMTVGAGTTDFTMEVQAPHQSVRCIAGPTSPLPSRAQGETAWRIISHLSLNYLSLVDAPGGEGASALRQLLRLYADPADEDLRKRIEGVRSAHTRPVLRRVDSPGPIAFARGLEVAVEFDETAFTGTGVFTLGAVLEQFFARYVSLNSFTETVIKSQQRGDREIMRWPARVGIRQII